MEQSPETVIDKNAAESTQTMASPPSPDEMRASKRSSLPARPNGAARHAKRMTLNFPINVPPTPTLRSDQNSPFPAVMTPASQSSAYSSPSLAAAPTLIDDSTDGYDFLTAIASQERRVLELREELQRAENDLATLKKQWALTERSRKRTQASLQAEVLKPLKSDTSAAGDQSPSIDTQSIASLDSPSVASVASKRLSRDLALRESIRASGDGGTSISANGRRVFHGSRHTRTLSLLSPDLNGSFRQTRDAGDAKNDNIRASRSPRSATLPSIDRNHESRKDLDDWKPIEESLHQWRRSIPPSSRDALVRTGKQMASDLREGLWTFLEDIRQATVGEEGISATESRGISTTRRTERSITPRSGERSTSGVSRSSSSASKDKARDVTKSGKDTKPADIGVSFWSEFGIDTPGQTSASSSRPAENTPIAQNERRDSNSQDVEDSWEAWDSPQSKKTHTPTSSSSTILSKRDQSPITQASSPRTNASVADWNPIHPDSVPNPSISESIPWPALAKLNTSKLTRTASSLMAEWERSLSSSPERRHSKRDSSLSSKGSKSD
ncbi:hypothetical protein DTO027B5_8920 [Paecilomyces variotii]|nr:hypothetical protein DTO169C6_6024 [Paecilomyces variotii]KAJ9327706.1 hypothetical protein DTO027B5_8920 [Paecilomyces variotii]KAJ9329763.1 hypothetical protein DTO027B3_250 [Paecilomyces variotii]